MESGLHFFTMIIEISLEFKTNAAFDKKIGFDKLILLTNPTCNDPLVTEDILQRITCTISSGDDRRSLQKPERKVCVTVHYILPKVVAIISELLRSSCEAPREMDEAPWPCSKASPRS